MNRRLDEFARAQENVLRREQLREAGVHRGMVASQVRARRWSTVGSMVVVLQTGPLTPTQRQWAAVLAAGRHAALAGRTALANSRLTGWEADAVHVLTPRGRTPPRITEFPVVYHETRRGEGHGFELAGQPPRTRLDRSAIDAAAWSRNARTACGLLAACVQQRLTTAARLQQALAEAGNVRFRKTMRLALADIAGGAEALSEIDFARFCRSHQLGRVAHQRIRRDGSGRKRYLDVLIEAPDGAQLLCEVDGAIHLLVEKYWADMHRGNELFIAGSSGLRFPSVALYLDENVVADQIRRALVAVRARRSAA